MTYNMESFLHSSVDLYLDLSRKLGFQSNLRDVATPFISEDHTESPQGARCSTGPVLYCPHCRHAFPQSESVPDSVFRATMKKLVRAAGVTIPNVKARSDLGPCGASGSLSAAGGDTDCGIMGSIAAKVLMKVMYAARMARPDLQRAICHLACFVTKWDSVCDRKLHRLMC